MIRKFLSILFIFFFLFTFQPVQESQADWKWLYGWMGIGTGDDVGKRKINGDTTIDGALNVVGTVTVLGSGNGLKYPSEAIGVDVSGIKSDGTLSSVFIGRDYVNGDTTFTIPEFASKFEITNSARSLYGMSGIFPQAVGMWSNTGFELKGAYNYGYGDVDAITATYSGTVYDMWDTEDRANFTDLTWGDVTPVVDANGNYPQASYYESSSSGQITDTNSGAYYLPIEIPLSQYDVGETITDASFRRSSVTGAGVVPFLVAPTLYQDGFTDGAVGNAIVESFEYSTTVEEKDGFKAINIYTKLTDDATRDTSVIQKSLMEISKSGSQLPIFELGLSDSGYYIEFDVWYDLGDNGYENPVIIEVWRGNRGGMISIFLGTSSKVSYYTFAGVAWQGTTDSTGTSDIYLTEDAWNSVRIEVTDDGVDANLSIKVGSAEGTYGTAYVGRDLLEADIALGVFQILVGIRDETSITGAISSEVDSWFKNIEYGRIP